MACPQHPAPVDVTLRLLSARWPVAAPITWLGKPRRLAVCVFLCAGRSVPSAHPKQRVTDRTFTQMTSHPTPRPNSQVGEVFESCTDKVKSCQKIFIYNNFIMQSRQF